MFILSTQNTHTSIDGYIFFYNFMLKQSGL